MDLYKTIIFILNRWDLSVSEESDLKVDLAKEISGAVESELNAANHVMLKDWFTESDDGNGGKMLMAECPDCGDSVVYGDGCIKCDANFEFK